jgi:hypothetical protein
MRLLGHSRGFGSDPHQHTLDGRLKKVKKTSQLSNSLPSLTFLLALHARTSNVRGLRRDIRKI